MVGPVQSKGAEPIGHESGCHEPGNEPRYHELRSYGSVERDGFRFRSDAVATDPVDAIADQLQHQLRTHAEQLLRCSLQ